MEKAGKDGFVRVRIDGEVMPLEDVPELQKNIKHNIELVVDRLVIRDGIRTRLADSVETALRYGEGLMIALIGKDEQLFSERFACPDCNISYPDIEPRLFSFNSPVGACPACDGLGSKTVFDPELVVPDASLSVEGGAIEPWAGRETFMYSQTLEAVAAFVNCDMDTPFNQLSESARKAFLYGSGREKIQFVYETPGQNRTVERPFEGVIPNLERRYRESSSDDVREALSKYIDTIDCPSCAGSRLTRAARHVRINDRSLPEIVAMPLREGVKWIEGLTLSEQQRAIADKVVEEIAARLGFMIEVGLDYLSLERTAGTLSGGRSEEHTSELQSHHDIVCRLLLEKKKNTPLEDGNTQK